MKVIKLHQKQEIILMRFREGASIRAIAKEVGVDRKTVRKYIRQYEQQRQQLMQTGDVQPTELIESIVQPPKYDTSKRKPLKVTDEVLDRIKYYLNENQSKRLKGQSKQMMKKIDIFEALKEEGFDIGYTTVCQTISKVLSQAKEAFIRENYAPGDICEFDWGEVKLCIGGVKRKYPMAVFTTAYGNYRYARLFTKQKSEFFQEAHAYFFKSIRGNHMTMVYDNMKVAVKSFVGHNERQPTDALLQLSIYYGFQFRFCNVCRGNEKGHVERSVEYIRRKAFAVRDAFDSLDDANRYLEDVCNRLNDKPQPLKDNKTAKELLEEERPYLLPDVPMFECSKLENLRVDKYSTVMFESCHYSVPDQYVGKIILAKIYPTKIIFMSGGEKIAEHPRRFGFNEWSIDIYHYIRTLKKKPGSLPNSTAFAQVSKQIKNIYHCYYTGKERDFVELLQYMKEKSKSVDEILEVIDKLLKICPKEISTNKIILLCENKSQVPVKSQQENEISQKAKEHLKIYGNLISGIRDRQEVALS